MRRDPQGGPGDGATDDDAERHADPDARGRDAHQHRDRDAEGEHEHGRHDLDRIGEAGPIARDDLARERASGAQTDLHDRINVTWPAP